MKYRELQKELKAIGLNAKGSRPELEARLADAQKCIETEYSPVTSDFKDFVFTGDPSAPGEDPPYLPCYGYMFKLNGRAITVKPEVAVKLAICNHFTEA